jgi:hypothetical protein
LATKWSELSQEQKDEKNAKRRAKRAALSLEEKEAIRAADRARKPKMSPGERLESRLIAGYNRRISRFKGRAARIMKWHANGCKGLWPALEDKLQLTGFYRAVLRVLGRKCCHCGYTHPHSLMDKFWRITRKEDFLAFVGHRTEEYKRVLRNPEDYQIYCLWCAADLRLRTDCWLLSPYSARNGGPTECASILGKGYSSLAPIWEAMYPKGDEALRKRIQAKAIRSLICEVTNYQGERVRAPIMKNRYHAWVFSQPRSCVEIQGLVPNVDDRGRIVSEKSAEEKPSEAGSVHTDVGSVQPCA